MKILIIILIIFICATAGYRINDDDEDKWARIPQIDGTFRLISVTEAKLLYEKEFSRRTNRIKIDFYLYTKSNPYNGRIINLHDVEALKKSNFNPRYQTRFIIHGWRNNVNSSVNNDIREAFLPTQNLNLFVVDWSSAADTLNYYSARYSVENVGKHIAKYLDFLHNNGSMSYMKLKLIGHSLGAHCAGYAGKNTKYGKIHTIIGLDPAWPLFSYNKTTERLYQSDALYVETIHTTGGLLGFLYPIGKASFYPNWGIKQPGCGIDATGQCSHERSYKLYSEAIIKNNFLSKKCDNYDKLLKKDCDMDVNKIQLGNPRNHLNANGIYFVPTNSEEPYGYRKFFKKL